MLHIYKPLQRQTGLNGHFGAFGKSYIIHIVFHFLHKTGFFQIFGNGLTAVETVHADIHSRDFGNSAVLVEYVYRIEIMALSQHIVVLVVCRGHLQAAGAELYVDIAIFDYRHHAADKRHHHFFTLEPCILRVFGVYAHGSVAHYSFGAGSSHDGIAASGRIGVYHLLLGSCGSAHIIICHIIAQIIQLRLLLLEEHFVVAYSGAVLRIPVNHPQTTINQPFLI